MVNNNRTVVIPASRRFADYIKSLKEEIEKKLGFNISSRFATDIIYDMMPKDIKIKEIEIDKKKHLKKDREIHIVLKYKLSGI